MDMGFTNVGQILREIVSKRFGKEIRRSPEKQAFQKMKNFDS